MAWWQNLGVSEMAIDPDVQVLLDVLEARIAVLEAGIVASFLPKEIAVVMPGDATTRYIQEPNIQEPTT